jgi:AcrR family transcriptional regulator
MSPPSRVSRQQIVDTAFGIVREHGWAQLSARNIAKELKSSTQPIYSNFNSMVDLEDEVVKSAIELRTRYQSETHTGILSLDHGIGYVLFAWEEPILFSAINDHKHSSMQIKHGDIVFDQHAEELSQNVRLEGFSDEQLRNFQFLGWIFIHGLASLKNWIDVTRRDLPREELIALLREGSRTLTRGFTQIQLEVSHKDKNGHKKNPKQTESEPGGQSIPKAGKKGRHPGYAH